MFGIGALARPWRFAFLAENPAAFGDETLGPSFARLYPRLHPELGRAPVPTVGPAVARYRDSGDDDAPIRAMAALPVGAGARPGAGVEILEVGSVARVAATAVHPGPMIQVAEGYQAVPRWGKRW